MKPPAKISPETVRDDFNDISAVIHYARAAHELGLWRSERELIERFFPERGTRLLEAGCGAGRVTLGLWEMGYRDVTAFDFAAEPIDQARNLAEQRGAASLRFLCADATDLTPHAAELGRPFSGALFMFNGMMQIPGRGRRIAALKELHRVCEPGAPLLFTTHDRDDSAAERAHWRKEARRWREGTQDPRLHEFGDRYFESEAGRTFMHLPDRPEILSGLELTGWMHEFDAMRSSFGAEAPPVREFSDECRFWVARRGPSF